MHVFFEDDGAFKAGTVLADNDTSLQVEAASGKRLKVKAANVLLRCPPSQSYRKARGGHGAAPADALAAALAGTERKRREAEQVAAWADELKAHRLPAAIRDKLPMLLYKPDKLALETRAVAAAC